MPLPCWLLNILSIILGPQPEVLKELLGDRAKQTVSVEEEEAASTQGEGGESSQCSTRESLACGDGSLTSRPQHMGSPTVLS